VELRNTTDAEKKKAFNEALQTAVGEDAVVRSLTPKVTLKVRDLDAITLEAEVFESVRKVHGESNGDIKAHLTKPNPWGQQLSFLEVREEDAKKIIETARLKIGWSNCRVRYKTTSKRCY